MHSSNTCDLYEGFCIRCKSTAESFLFLFTLSLPPHPPCPQSALDTPHRIALSPTPSCSKPHQTYSYVTCSKFNAKTSRTSSDVTI
jgi:hypothetical protein